MTTPSRPVPEQLRQAVALWIKAGRHPQRGSSWSLRTWTQEFPELSGYLAELAELANGITRADVIARCSDRIRALSRQSGPS